MTNGTIRTARCRIRAIPLMRGQIRIRLTLIETVYSGRPAFAVRRKPLHTTTSMSVYVETLRSRRPALVFTLPKSPGPNEDNGLLQAWEIFEHVRIDADLVTLSACESGLGKEIVGEGLVGLTRAFLHAGRPSHSRVIGSRSPVFGSTKS